MKANGNKRGDYIEGMDWFIQRTNAGRNFKSNPYRKRGGDRMEVEFCEECGEPYLFHFDLNPICRVCFGFPDSTILAIKDNLQIFKLYYREELILSAQYWIDNCDSFEVKK